MDISKEQATALYELYNAHIDILNATRATIPASFWDMPTNDLLTLVNLLFALNNNNLTLKPTFRTRAFENINQEHLYTEETLRNKLLNTTMPNTTGIKLIFNSITKGVTILNKADKYFKDETVISMAVQEDANHRVRVYKTEDNIYQIYSNNITKEMVLKIILMLPKLNKTLKMPKELEEIIFAALENNINAFILKVKSYLNNSAMLRQHQFSKIKELFEKIEYNQMNALKNSQTTYNNDLNNLMADYSRIYSALQDTILKINALELKESKDYDEVIDYMIKNKSVQNIKTVNSNTIKVTITHTLDMYDMAVIKKYYNRPVKPNMLTNEGKDIENLIKTIFIDEKFKIRCYTTININMTNMQRTIASEEITQIIANRYQAIWQPHLMLYNCWGNNGALITKALTERDLIGAFEQMIGAAANLNMLDTTVLARFVKTLATNRNVRCIVDPKTNETITIQEAINIIKGEAQNENNPIN